MAGALSSSVGPLLMGAAAIDGWSWVAWVAAARERWAWWLVLLVVAVFAYLTNPTQASFHTHLTSLSFHTYLRRRPSSPTPYLSVSNRISLQIRTPPYSLANYFFFSVVLLGADRELWIGAFGRWYAWKGEEDEEDDVRQARIRDSVQKMVVESPVVSSPQPSHHHKDSRSRNESKLEPCNPSTASAQASASPSPASLPAPITAPPPEEITTKEDLHDLPASFFASVDTEDPVVEELKTQVEELRTASLDSEKRLQVELEALRARKKEEDVFRSELKAKTKVLEEAKRVAEIKRHDAEKVLSDRKAEVREVLERVNKIKDEIKSVERKEKERVERKEKKKKDRKEKEKRLRDEVGKKKLELKEREEEADLVGKKVEALEKTVEARREILVSRRVDLSHRAGLYGIGPYGYPHSSVYRRFPVSYPPVIPSSRPASVRSGQYEYHSPPASPTVSSAVVHAPHTNGFLEHRLAHRREHPTVLDHSTPDFIPLAGTLPSVSDIPRNFLPFDFDSASSPSPPGSNSGQSGSRPQLSLPLQYLDTGLLAGDSDSPGIEGPLSPMTPHQTSLIPTQLFNMLDEDDEDSFVGPESPIKPHGMTSTAGRLPWNSARSGLDPLAITTSAISTASPTLSNMEAPSPLDVHSPTWKHSPRPLSMDAQDDIPRVGLSLNPDAKAFAFALKPSTSSHSIRGVETNRRSGEFGTSNSTAVAAVPVSTSLSRPIFDPFGVDDELLGPLRK